MENQQNQQPTSAEPLALEDENKQAQAYISPKKLADSYFLRKLIQRHPLLVLLGVSAFLLFAIYSSVVSIFQVGVIKEEIKSISRDINSPNTQPISTDNSLSLWSIGALGLGAITGGVAIAKRLSNSSSELSQFFLQFHAIRQPQQQFPPVRQSILSLPALKLSEPQPTWAESSMETELQLNIYAENDEFVIVLEEDFLDDREESCLEAVELTVAEKNLIFESIDFEDTSKLEELPSSEVTSNSALENDTYPPHSISLVEMLDLRRKIPLATLLKINE
jgi:hypothetical protein